MARPSRGFSESIGIWKCWFLRRGENRSARRKTSRSKDENQQQTQPTFDAESGNRTRATLVGGLHGRQMLNHCAIPAPPLHQDCRVQSRGPVRASVLLRDVDHLPPHIQQLEQFHQRCLRKICNIKWQDRVSNLQVLEKCGLPSIECLIIKCQLRWTGHIVRMEDDRIQKMLLYGQMKEGHRDQGRPFKRYKDTLKANLKSCNIDVNSWEATAHDRALWRYQCAQGTKDFEVNRAAAIQAKKERRKQRSASVDSFPCSICGRSCESRIVLHSHMRTHLGK